MPTSPTYPGVYLEEVPSGVQTLVAVSTSATAMVGFTARGPVNQAVQIFNTGDYERAFGGLSRDSAISYAVQQFFLNGGSEAWIVRVADNVQTASIILKSGVDPIDPDVLEVTARSAGIWGNNLRIVVDDDTANPDSLFNLTITELVDQQGTIVPGRIEKHRNLSMSSFSPGYVEDVLDAASELVRVARVAPLAAFENDKATSTSGLLAVADLQNLDSDHRRLALTVDGTGPVEFDFMQANDPAPATLGDLATLIQNGATAALGAGVVTIAVNSTGDRLVATAETADGEGERSIVHFGNASLRNAASILKLGRSYGGREVDGTAGIRPQQSGTVNFVPVDPATLLPTGTLVLEIQIPHLTPDAVSLPLWTSAANRPTTLEELRTSIEKALKSSTRPVLNQASVTLVDSKLQIVGGGMNPSAVIQFQGGPNGTNPELNLVAPNAAANISAFALGSAGPSILAQHAGATGEDGNDPTPTTVKGVRADKTGMYSLEDVDLFNLLVLPGETDPDLLSAAIAYATERRAFVILDVPATVDTKDKAKQWMTDNASLRSRNAAVYFPWVHFADPLEQNRLRAFPACGAVAGLYARTDAARGVWKAPAGTEATLDGVQKLSYVLTDLENGVLNPLGMNCIRNFPVFGPVVWGARTLDGADALASEWKYIPVRRFALFLEESLFRGTKWVVFEPNDEPLWAQIRLNVGAFMQDLFRQDAFQGQTPREAYFVKCDNETTTQTDVNLGIVNVIVGFAPLKPAEFVIIKIQQMAGQVPT